MPHNRFFLKSNYQLNQEVYLEGEEAHHLIRVMRHQVGESVELVNGMDQIAQAQITKIEKRGADLLIQKVEEKKPPEFRLILCQAIPRMNRLEMIVEKATELGMTELWLFPGEKSEKKEISPQQELRLKAITIAAMKQSGRLDLPLILFKPFLSAWNALPSFSFFGDADSISPPLLKVMTEIPDFSSCSFFVGPESGFSSHEIEHLQHLRAVGVCLHANTLRTETAALTALSVISHFLLQKRFGNTL